MQHVAHGAKGYSRSVGVTLDESEGKDFDPKYRELWSATKTIASNLLIECAVKFRLLQDFVEKNNERAGIAAIEVESIGGLEIDSVMGKRMQLNLRDAANKVIHASTVELKFLECSTTEPPLLHWSGMCKLAGRHGGKDWRAELRVAEWCLAVSRYIDLLDKAGMFDYLGQDYA